MSALNNLVAQVSIRSEYGPNVVIDQPFSGAPSSGGGSLLLRILKPEITITPGYGLAPQTVAPWGTPGPTKWPFVEMGLIVAAALGVGLIIRGLRKT